ncbi:MAG: SUMF1/EgtB/PvdO family nonheme iron enzyme, partial [Spirochaetales bacterium]|nr:SUMF1/EgtB/PvdO family nonheme iron enzyme [Spirochaetales bacterium]
AAEAFVSAGLSRDDTVAFFLRGAALVRNEDTLQDYLQGFSHGLAGKGVFSANTLLEIVKYYIQYVDQHPAFLFWLPEALTEDRQKLITESPWFRQTGTAYAEKLQNLSEDVPKFSDRVTLQGNSFIGVRGGSFLLGGDSAAEYPVKVEVPDLYVLDREVTREMYRRFLEKNPAWRKNALDTLLKEALVTEDYLKDLELAGEIDLPVRYVSFHAAKAYCAWLQEELPESYSGWTVRLPYEAEWEWLALRDDRNEGIFLSTGITGPQAVQNRAPSSLGTYDLSGNLWEWCENWFYPAGYTVENGYRKIEDSYKFETGAEKAVRGGSWANRREEVTIRSRGSQPADWCTPFIGFRPVLVRE